MNSLEISFLYKHQCILVKYFDAPFPHFHFLFLISS